MKKTSILGMAALAIIASISIYAVSPYFTNTTIDESLPENIITTRITEDTNSMISETMMEDDAMIKDAKLSGISFAGDFVGVDDGIHNAKGIAKVISLEDGSSILRLEDFESTNGPDLYVYLSIDEKASDYVSLGRLKANAGNQNYELPGDIDLSKHNKVLIWCQAFSVLFGSAELQVK